MKLKLIHIKWVIPSSGLLIVIAVMNFWPGKPDDPTLPQTVDYNYHIRPILSQNCYTCHGPDSSTREAGLRLDNFDGATALLKDGGAAIVPRSIRRSKLLDRITSHDPSYQMPPPESKKILSAREIALLQRWIKQGAKWKPHWAFMKPEMPRLPKTLNGASPSQIIDHLIDKEVQSKQLTLSGTAEKHTLIRRISYLMTGLPPHPEDLHRFLADTTEAGYENIVDYYLASPHFGERWARHWMDLVRYGESMGHEGDFNISHPFEYRDYLIRAFNQDVPYHLLVKEHLAGDMLPEPRYHPEAGFNESVMGTGYFYLGEGKHGPVNIKLEEATKIDNVIDVTAKTFQALTVACARCHDHKFDPIPTTDYYAMYGMFESARIGPIPARRTRHQDVLIDRLTEMKGEIRSLIGRHWMEEMAAESPVQQAQFLKSRQDKPTAINTRKDYRMIGDFRNGAWEGWYADGRAFGNGPLMGEPVIDRKTYSIKGLNSGFASSRAIATGIQGVLRSPNFIIDHDSIAIRARGINGQIRIIVENFQVIQGPLYDKYEAILDNAEWDTYIFDVSLVKGRKAYIQFTPGNYGQQTAHIYRIKPGAYIEVQYALSFKNGLPDVLNIQPDDQPDPPSIDKKQAILDWIKGQAEPQQVNLLEDILANKKGKLAVDSVAHLVNVYDNIAGQVYDSTHFIGLTEGDAVFSSVFVRGSVDQPSEEKVPHRFLSAVNAGPDSFPQQGSGRLAWAEAVTDSDNPLSSRVIVNRIWHHIFGRGIVETVDNFGIQGSLPSHPELLDYLALQMISEGWSMKKMIRHILLTQAFRRSTEALDDNYSIDPDNIFLHSFPIRRLEAEAIRDGILAVSGCMDSTMFGPPVPVHLTDFMTGRGRPRVSGPLDGMGRRSIYTAVRRNFIPPMMLVFDTPIPFSTFGRRNTTNVPAQSLTLLNDPFVHEQAGFWAEKLLRNRAASIEQRINEIYTWAFSRNASPEEVEKALLFLDNQAKMNKHSLEEMKNDHQLWSDYCHTVFNLKEFIHLL